MSWVKSMTVIRPSLRLLLAVASFVALAGVGCKSSLPFVWVNDLPRIQDSSRIQVGDKVSILVRNQPQLSGEFDVRPNGTYNQPLVGEIPISGLTPEEAATQLATLLKGIVVEPLTAVSILQPRSLRVSVIGEIKNQSAVELTTTHSVLDLIARAGGLTEFADEDSIYILRRNPRLIRIRFRYRDLVGGDPRSVEFKIRDGDTLIVE
jgi:polysaccharide export outer membrane protein